MGNQRKHVFAGGMVFFVCLLVANLVDFYCRCQVPVEKQMAHGIFVAAVQAVVTVFLLEVLTLALLRSFHATPGEPLSTSRNLPPSAPRSMYSRRLTKLPHTPPSRLPPLPD